MQVRLIEQNLWMLYDAEASPVGMVRIKTCGIWEISEQYDPDYFHPRGQLPLGSLFSGVLPETRRFNEQVQSVIHLLQSNNDLAHVVEQLLPWFPLLLAGQYAQRADWRAQLALLFVRLIMDWENPALLATQALLEQQAYEALAEMVEAMPATTQDEYYRVLERAFKEAFRAWQPRITDPNNRWLFAYLTLQVEAEAGVPVGVRIEARGVTDAEIALRREAAMLSLLTKVVAEDDTRQRQLHRFFREAQQGQEAVRILIERWFLPRYDLQAAEQLKTALYSCALQDKRGYLPKQATGWTRWLHWSQLVAFVLMLVYLLLTTWFWPALQVGLGATAIKWLTGVLYLVGGVPPLVFWFFSGRPDLSLPRLVAGILAALIGTILQQHWDAVLRFAYLEGQPWLRFSFMSLVCLGFLLAAGRVMILKVGQATEYPFAFRWGKSLIGRDGEQHRLANTAMQKLVLERALTVLQRGWLLACLLSLLMIDMLGSSYLTEIRQATCGTLPCVPGVFGMIYPLLVCFLSTLLLFVGVFIQFIGDDRALTEAVA